MILDVGQFCAKTAGIWHFVGNIITVFKIAVPAILIVWGVIILGKALIASDDKEIKEAWGKLFKRLLIGLIIFFVPSIVSAVVSLVNADEANDTSICFTCVAHPSKCPE